MFQRVNRTSGPTAIQRLLAHVLVDNQYNGRFVFSVLLHVFFFCLACTVFFERSRTTALTRTFFWARAPSRFHKYQMSSPLLTRVAPGIRRERGRAQKPFCHAWHPLSVSEHPVFLVESVNCTIRHVNKTRPASHHRPLRVENFSDDLKICNRPLKRMKTTTRIMHSSFCSHSERLVNLPCCFVVKKSP